MTPSQMYTRFHGKLDKMLQSMAPQADDDFKQDAWERLFLRADQISEQDNPDGFFHVCASRIVIDLLRRQTWARKRARKHQEVTDSDLGWMEPLTEGFVVPEATRPETREQYRQTVWLLSEGYYQKEIAQCLGVTPMRVFWLVQELRNNGQRIYQHPSRKKAA